MNSFEEIAYRDYLLEKEEGCELDEKEREELHKLIDTYGYSETEKDF